MTGTKLTPGAVCRLAAPYFRSKDSTARRILLFAVVAIELSVIVLRCNGATHRLDQAPLTLAAQ